MLEAIINTNEFLTIFHFNKFTFPLPETFENILVTDYVGDWRNIKSSTVVPAPMRPCMYIAITFMLLYFIGIQSPPVEYWFAHYVTIDPWWRL